jgi:hypothetical protein
MTVEQAVQALNDSWTQNYAARVQLWDQQVIDDAAQQLAHDQLLQQQLGHQQQQQQQQQSEPQALPDHRRCQTRRRRGPT